MIHRRLGMLHATATLSRLGLVSLLLLAGVLSGQPSRANDGALDASAIAELIRQLDDDSYEVRREATRKLGEADMAAIAPLSRAAAGTSLETAFRALDSLARLSFSKDAAVEDAAFTALSSIADSSYRTSGRAKIALGTLRQHYQARAKDRLQQLGAVFENGGRSDDGVIILGGGGMIVRPGVIVDRSDLYFGNSVTIGDSWTGKPTDLRLLARLAGLDQIVLTGAKVTDDVLAELACLSTANVRHISLRKCAASDTGLAHLGRLKTLTNIDIMHTPVSDAAVETVGTLPELRYIRMYGTKVTASGEAALAKKLPNARIDRRGGALLGVGGAINEQPCVINTVQEESAAAKAGIRVGDVVMQFDGKSVQNFTELTAAIAEKTGGEKVEIVLLRPADSIDGAEPLGAKPHRVTVTLGEW